MNPNQFAITVNIAVTPIVLLHQGRSTRRRLNHMTNATNPEVGIANIHANINTPLRLTQYFLARGTISDVSTASNSNFGSSASGAKYAFVVFSQFLSSRSGKSGL
jgi:hypothetical protein